jgi:hypothetical protein
MTPVAALGAALRDLYQQSWRLFLLNAALSAFVVPVVIAGLWLPALWVLLVLAGPLAAGLMHCAVVVASTEELRLRDAVAGVRIHWRRGLALGALLAVVAVVGAHAVSFYASRVLLLAVVAVYLLVVFCAFQLVLWPLAVFEVGRPIPGVLQDAGRTLLARPLQSLALGLALLAVNLAGVVAAVMPFLTLTVAYSFLAAAHFALARPKSEDAS